MLPSGNFDKLLHFHTNPAQSSLIPLAAATAAQSSAFELSRLAVPEPVFLATVNQIGFDFYDMLAGAVRVGAPDASNSGSLLIWLIGASHDAAGNPVPSPAAGFTFPLAGTYRNDSFILANPDLTLNFEFGAVPTTDFELRGQMLPDLSMAPDAGLYAQSSCLKVPFYGALIVAFGLCDEHLVLTATGTYITNAYHPAVGANPANQPPPGVALKSLAYSAPSLLQGGSVTAALDLSGAGSYPAARHLLGILLVDESSGQPVPIDYHSNLTETQDANGNLVGATLAIPARTTMPASMSVYVMTDVYPFFERSGVTGAFVQ